LPQETEANVELDVVLDPHVSYAMSQNAIPVLRELNVTNRGDAELEDLTLRVALQPEVAALWERRIPALAQGSTYGVDDVPLAFDHQQLMNLGERVLGRCQIELLRGEDVVSRKQLDLELLAYNEWRADTLPQLLAAFVQPNHPVIAETLLLAREPLQQLTGDPSLEGYQSRDPARVRAMARAVYQTMQELGITYSSPPASFRKAGQKVRTPDQLLGQHMGTCLDLALFYAACLEQVGLMPVLVVLEGHAFAGVWLEKDHPRGVLWDDVAMVRNEVDADQLLLVDSSPVASRPAVPFERAVQAARGLLTASFDYMVDVACAREEHVLPLPARVERGRFQAAPEVLVRAEPLDPATERRVQQLLRSAEQKAAASAQPQQEKPEIPEDARERLERWRTRLLDLSLRNRLLNVRLASVIRLVPPDLAVLEDELVSGTSFGLRPRLQAYSDQDPRSAEIFRAHTGGDPLAELTRKGLENGELFTHLDEDGLDQRLKALARAGRESLEEGGVQTIFIGLGILCWYEADSSQQERLAPLLLLPVELHRKSAREHYRLRLADEESLFNTTLIEKLKQDFGIDIPELSGDLPADDAGLDVPLILNHVRQAIRGMRRWEVKSEVVLGQFSFSKLLMWRDLGANAHHMLESEVVRHLARGAKAAFPDQGPFPAEQELDTKLDLSDFPCPKDADSSQLAAIEAAREGKTFVLQGPPGTGKSQTITNLVAASLAQGRSVLFVSEKMAALDVVHRRLAQVGLGDFCLELHSNKARKKAVLEQLGATLEREPQRAGEDWGQLTTELAAEAEELNGYLDALHRPRPQGYSAFTGMSQLAGLRDVPQLQLDLGSPASLTRDRLRQLESLVEALNTALAEVGDPATHPFTASHLRSFDPALVQSLPRQCATALAALKELREAAADASRLALDGIVLDTSKQLAAVAAVASAVVRSSRPRLALLREADVEAAGTQLQTLAAAGGRSAALTTDLAKRWDQALFDLDLQGLLARYRRWGASFFLLAFVMLWGARATLRRVLRAAKLPSAGSILGDLEQALESRRLLEEVQRAAPAVQAWTGPVLVAEGASWERVHDHAVSAVELRSRLRAAELPRPVIERISLLASREGDDEPGAEAARAGLGRYARAWDAFAAARDGLLQTLEADADGAFGADAGFFERATSVLRSWSDRPQLLREMTHLRTEQANARARGLEGLSQALLSGMLAPERAIPSLRRSFHTAWVNATVRDEPVLSSFSGRQRADRIDRFASLDRRFIAAGGAHVAGRLTTRLPRSGGTGGEMGVLRRELQKQRRHLPIRKLFEQIPTLLRRLKPCLLMSPLSVAQYLDPKQPPFDLVVFDEASQIPVPDAIGAIARGRQLIVVGDSKQLPPTNFFGRSHDMDEDEKVAEDSVEELESILDECLAAQLPEQSLKWHYRSQHETLIAFSNHHYYDNRLFTFPSADDRRHVMGVSHVAVPDGVYESGTNRHNKREAEVLVHEVVRRLRDPRERTRSIGVVTFSQAQMSLIDTLLDEARRKHPEIEPYFGEVVREHLFVKNLESVQGDERDVILFSVGYGPNQAGKISMNFGPLNREGGERRLNVAVTRARQQLIVFSTLRADQIDLRRTRATGAHHLRHFLDYAERGPKAIAQATVVEPGADFDSPFEKQVHAMLSARGWDVDAQVGCSGYRIDLAVRDPDHAGRYLAGVECDGAYYHSAHTARDRDRLRQGVLESLGWTLLRIWSTDFWYDAEAAIDAVHRRLVELQQISRKEERTLTGTNAPVAAEEDPLAAAQGVAETRASYHPLPAAAARRASEPPEHLRTYELAELPAFLGDSNRFYSPKATAEIAGCIAAAVRAEGPIHRKLLARRIMAPYSLERATKRVMQRLDSVLRTVEVRIEDEFIWHPDVDASNWQCFRVPGSSPDTIRKAEEIASHEMANAAAFVLERNLGMLGADLVREMAGVFGIQRVTERIAGEFERGVLVLLSSGRAREQAGQITLV